MIGIIRDVNFIAFTIMIVNVPLMILQQKLKHVSTDIVKGLDIESEYEQPFLLAGLFDIRTAIRNNILLLPVLSVNILFLIH